MPADENALAASIKLKKVKNIQNPLICGHLF
jgi:hypothetical protein